MKPKIKRLIVKELRDIRQSLKLSIASSQIDSVLNGVEIELTPPAPQKRETKSPGPVLITDLDSLRQSLSAKIQNKSDLYSAMAYWSVANLLDFTMEQRSAICSTLVAKSMELGVKPKPAWVSILKTPEFFEEWANELYGDPSDSEASLDEVMS